MASNKDEPLTEREVEILKNLVGHVLEASRYGYNGYWTIITQEEDNNNLSFRLLYLGDHPGTARGSHFSVITRYKSKELVRLITDGTLTDTGVDMTNLASLIHERLS